MDQQTAGHRSPTLSERIAIHEGRLHAPRNGCTVSGVHECILLRYPDGRVPNVLDLYRRAKDMTGQAY